MKRESYVESRDSRNNQVVEVRSLFPRQSPFSFEAFEDEKSQSISTSRDAHKIKLHCGDLATHRHQRAVRTFPPSASAQQTDGIETGGMAGKAIS